MTGPQPVSEAAEAAPGPPPERTGPFGPISAGARLTYVWAALLLPAVFLMVANVAALPFAVPALLWPDLGVQTQFWLLAAVILTSFVPFAAAAIFWARAFERRSLGSIGLAGPAWRYGRGLLVGIGLAALMLGVAAAFAPQEGLAILQGLPRLVSAEGAVFVAVYLALFIIQSGAEEVVFRGWALSSIAARRGPMAGVLLSSAAFAAVHFQHLFFAPFTGALVMLGVGLIGAVLAFLAMAERSIWGACGAHASYNFLLMTTAAAQMMAEDAALRPFEVAVRSFTEITQVTEFDPSVPASVAALVLLAVAAWALWRRAAGRAMQPAGQDGADRRAPA